MIRTIALFLFLALSPFVRADAINSEAELRPFTDHLMALVVSSGMAAVFDAMKPLAAIPEAEFQSLSLASQSQREQFGSRLGKTIGYEFISQKKVGDSLIRFVYIEKTDKTALSWYFYFFKTEKGWVINTFTWNAQVAPLF
jgi:hypothetical protein